MAEIFYNLVKSERMHNVFRWILGFFSIPLFFNVVLPVLVFIVHRLAVIDLMWEGSILLFSLNFEAKLYDTIYND